MRSLINLAAAAGILLVVVGITLAFVVKAREAAAVSQCKSNLRQVGISMHNYASTYNNFLPPGTIPNKDLPPERRLSWLPETLQFMEQMGLIIDRTKAWDANENLQPRGYGIDTPPWILGDVKSYLCPKNPNRTAFDGLGVTHYVGIAGLGEDAAEWPLEYRPGLGCFGYDRRIKITDISDGTAATLMVIETGVGNGPWTAGGPPTVRGLNQSQQPYLGKGRQFGGMHRGGTMAVFADGSARLIKDSINSSTFEAFVTITGGEEVGAFDAD